MASFYIDDQVMHFRDGLSKIVGKSEINGINYFIVAVIREGGEKIYVPVDKADAVIRPLTDKKDVKEIIAFIKTIEPEYITNTKQRRDSFKRRLGSGEIKDLAYLARQLYFYCHPEELAVPVKFGPADLDMLRNAANIFYDELAIVYKADRNKIESLIISQL